MVTGQIQQSSNCLIRVDLTWRISHACHSIDGPPDMWHRTDYKCHFLLTELIYPQLTSKMLRRRLYPMQCSSTTQPIVYELCQVIVNPWANVAVETVAWTDPKGTLLA